MTLDEVVEQEKQPTVRTKSEKLSPVGGGWGLPMKGQVAPWEDG